MKGLTVYPVTEAVGAGGETIKVMPITYETLAPKKGGKPGEYEYRKAWFAAMVPYAPTDQRPILNPLDAEANAKLRTLPGNGLPPGIEKTYVPKPDDTLESITTAAYGKDSWQGEETIAKANQIFRRQHAVRELLKSGALRPGQAINIPYGPEGTQSVRDWLDAAARAYPWVGYHYAWWKEPKKASVLYMGGSFLIVGVIWPAMMFVLTNAGLGKRRAEPAYDLSRFGKGKPELKPRPVAVHGMTSEDEDRLKAIEDAVAASLAKADTEDRQRADDEDGPAPIRELSNRPLEPETAVGEKEEESMEYKGEFYPVVKSTTKAEGEDVP